MIWMLTMLSFVRWLEGREDNKVQVKKKKKKKNFFFFRRRAIATLWLVRTRFSFYSFFLLLPLSFSSSSLVFLLSLFSFTNLLSPPFHFHKHSMEMKKRKEENLFLKEQQQEQSQPASTVPRAACRSWECHHHVKRVLNYPFKSCGVFSRVSIGWVWICAFLFLLSVTKQGSQSILSSQAIYLKKEF